MHDASDPKNRDERWVPLPEHPDYEVSTLGRVRSVDRVSSQSRAIRGRVLKVRPMPSGYLRVNLHGKSEYVHRLVLKAFVGECPPGMESAHGDGDRSNNRLSNLKWKTHQANCDDRYEHGTVYYGADNPAWTGDRCGKGHPYTKENTRFHKRGKNVVRHCRACARERSRNPNLSPGKVFMTEPRIALAMQMVDERRHVAKEIWPALRAIDGPPISRSALYSWIRGYKQSEREAA